MVDTAALAHLRQYPDRPFVREETLNGVDVLRYAQADRMLGVCVACHNGTAGSPKTDWQCRRRCTPPANSPPSGKPPT